MKTRDQTTVIIIKFVNKQSIKSTKNISNKKSQIKKFDKKFNKFYNLHHKNEDVQPKDGYHHKIHK